MREGATVSDDERGMRVESEQQQLERGNRERAVTMKWVESEL